MKNIIILIVMLLAYSAIAEARIEIKKVEVLKTQDGKVQFCKESPDYYLPATYSLHDLNHSINNKLIQTQILAIGKKCEKSLDPQGNNVYLWKEQSLFTPYSYEVMKYIADDFISEYVTVKDQDLKAVVVDRSFNRLGEFVLDEVDFGQGKALFEVDITKGILEQNRDQFENGKVVSSVFFVYIQSKRILSYSWNDEEDQFINAGSAYSFVYYIQRK